MTRKQNSAEKARWKEELRQWLREDRDLLRGLVEEAVQQVLEAEMEEALQAERRRSVWVIEADITAGRW
jgi:transposase-like protein